MLNITLPILHSSLSLIVLVGFCSLGFAQQVSATGGAVVVDGSKTPDLIPDSTAFRLVLCGLAEPPNPTNEQAARQSRKLSRLLTTDADRRVFSALLAGFQAQYAALRAQYGSKRGLNASQPYAPIRDALVTDTINKLERQLTPEAMIRFRAFVKNAKQRMIIHHIN